MLSEPSHSHWTHAHTHLRAFFSLTWEGDVKGLPPERATYERHQINATWVNGVHTFLGLNNLWGPVMRSRTLTAEQEMGWLRQHHWLSCTSKGFVAWMYGQICPGGFSQSCSLQIQSSPCPQQCTCRWGKGGNKEKGEAQAWWRQ